MTLKNSTLLIRHQTADHGKRESESSLVPYSNFLIPQDSWGSCRILRNCISLAPCVIDHACNSNSLLNHSSIRRCCLPSYDHFSFTAHIHDIGRLWINHNTFRNGISLIAQTYKLFRELYQRKTPRLRRFENKLKLTFVQFLLHPLKKSIRKKKNQNFM